MKGLTVEFLDALISKLEKTAAELSENSLYLKKVFCHFMSDIAVLKEKLIASCCSHKKIKPSLLAAWATMISERFEFLWSRLSEENKAYQKLMQADRFANKVLKNLCGEQLPAIYYSQKVCVATFAIHDTKQKGDFPYNGRSIMSVAEFLQHNPDKIDDFKVRITHLHFKDQSLWIALNNRSMAAINMAGLKPLRYLPDEPTEAELKRLQENVHKIYSTFKSSNANATKKTFNFFKQIDNEEELAPFSTITGMDGTKPMFTVQHYQLHRDNQEIPNSLCFK